MVSVFVSVFVFVFVFVSVFQGVGMDLYLHLLLHWLEATTLGPAGSTSGSYGKPAALLDNYERHVLANLCLEPSSFLFWHTYLNLQCRVKMLHQNVFLHVCILQMSMLSYQFKALCLKASSSRRCRNCSENNKSKLGDIPEKLPKANYLKAHQSPKIFPRQR